MALRTLYQTLLDSDLARLRVIAQQWSITLLAERRADLAAELADAMARVEAVDRVWEELPEDQRAALYDLQRHGGARPWAVFTRRWGQIRPVGPGRLERESLWREPISPAEGLWYLGLVQRAFDPRPSGAVEMAFVPDELALYLPEPPPHHVPPPEPTPPPRHVIAGDDGLADDLVTLWAALRQRALPPDAERHDAPVRAQCHAPAAPRLALLKTLAVEQGWLHRDEDNRLHLSPEPTLAWLQSEAWAQWATLAQAWMTSAGWNDLAHVPTLRLDPPKAWPNDPLTSRRAFLDILRQCAPGVWYDLADFVAYARAHATDFLRPDGDYESWPLRDAQTCAALRGFDHWDAVEGALVAHYLTGPLTWLGWLDLGRADPAFPPGAFRLNAAGAAFLELGDPPALAAPDPVAVLADGGLRVPARRRYGRFQLSRVAQFAAWDGASYIYRLTPRSLARAAQQRITVPRILSFLEEATGQPLPDTLRAAIQNAAQSDEAARLERVWLLRVPDPAALAAPGIQRCVVETLAPGVALIRHRDKARVLTLLLQAGILPDVQESGREAALSEPR